MILLHSMNQIRLYIAIKTNKVESMTPWSFVFFIILSIGCLGGYFYFMYGQTYTLLLEFIIVGLAILGSIFEIVFVLLGNVEFRSLENSA